MHSSQSMVICTAKTSAPQEVDTSGNSAVRFMRGWNGRVGLGAA